MNALDPPNGLCAWKMRLCKVCGRKCSFGDIVHRTLVHFQCRENRKESLRKFAVSTISLAMSFVHSLLSTKSTSRISSRFER